MKLEHFQKFNEMQLEKERENKELISTYETKIKDIQNIS